MLTKSQQKAYSFIRHYIAEQGIAPTLQEIGQGIGVNSKGTISRYVARLIELGLVNKQRQAGSSRNLILTDKTFSSGAIKFNKPVPLVGTIAAGSPIEAIADHESYDINDVIRGEELFMLRVKGQSMIEEGIFDGDYVICERTQVAKEGDIVIALIDNEQATLKRIYYPNELMVLLCPANCDMAPMEVDAKRVQIQGILRCQLRSY